MNKSEIVFEPGDVVTPRGQVCPMTVIRMHPRDDADPFWRGKVELHHLGKLVCLPAACLVPFEPGEQQRTDAPTDDLRARWRAVYGAYLSLQVQRRLDLKLVDQALDGKEDDAATLDHDELRECCAQARTLADAALRVDP